MRIEPQRLLDSMRREYPEEMQQIDDMMHLLPSIARGGDRTGDVSDDVWRGMPVGLLNRVNIPLQFGGPVVTSTAVRRAILIERISYFCPAIPIGMPGPGLSTPPVISLGTLAQRKAYFERFSHIDDRPVWGAFAITEPAAGSDATAIRTQAVADGDDYILNGEKCFITCGGRADVIVAFATLDKSKGRFGIRAFVVPTNTPGFACDRLEDMMGLRVSQLSSLSFTDCRVPKEYMLGHTGKRGPLIDAFAGAQGAWDYMRPVIAAGIVGSCAGILDEAEKFVNSGQSLLAQKAKDYLFSEIHTLRAKVRSAQLLAYRAAWRYDRRQHASADSSMAKAFASSLGMEVAERVCSHLALHAIVNGERFEKFYRDAKAFDIIEGTGDMQRLLVAKGYQPPLSGDADVAVERQPRRVTKMQVGMS